MSLLIFIFYWIGIPALVLLVTRWLFLRANTPLHKGLVVIASAAGLLGLLWLAEGEKWLLDRQVAELCAKDGGIKVYETVMLPPERFDKFGNMRIPFKEYAKPTDEYILETEVKYLKQGNLEMWRDYAKVIRRTDGKVLGEEISYARRGGDIPGPWHDSSFRCPSPSQHLSIESAIFSKGDKQ